MAYLFCAIILYIISGCCFYNGVVSGDSISYCVGFVFLLIGIAPTCNFIKTLRETRRATIIKRLYYFLAILFGSLFPSGLLVALDIESAILSLLAAMGSILSFIIAWFAVMKALEIDRKEKESEPTGSVKSTSKRGQEYEKACALRLIREGYKDVTLTPVTGDFGADIVAIHPKGYRVCFQCKFYSGNVGEKAVQEVLAAMQYYNASAGAVLTTANFTPKAKELARKTGVQLVPHYDAHLDWIDRVEEFDAFMN